jgi:hypothetical protein
LAIDTIGTEQAGADKRPLSAAWRKPRDPAKLCGAKTNPLVGEHPCRNGKGQRTDHRGFGQCWLHGGRAPNNRKYAAHEQAVAEALAAFAGVPLKKLGEALAREAAARAIVTETRDTERFGANVRAFAQASERAEGSELTVESRLTFLAELPDEELEAAIAEAQRLIEGARKS